MALPRLVTRLIADAADPRRWPRPRWMDRYRPRDAFADLLAGLITAIVLVPQGMAYALLAGLPPATGLYAGLLPPVIYAALGSSRALAVGPVALMSLLTLTTLAGVPVEEPAARLAAAALLAGLVGLLLLAMGLLRVGFLVNFISQPVISGFTSAAAVTIALSQLAALLGLDVERSHTAGESLAQVARHLSTLHLPTLGVGLLALTLLVFFQRALGPLLSGRLPPAVRLRADRATLISRAGPLVAVAATIAAVSLLGLDRHGVAIVGDIPAGLPALSLPTGLLDLALIQALLPGALAIAVIGYLESVAVAKALAARRRESIQPNQELIALGGANLGAGLIGAYPVAGGFGRSMVNDSAGARTPLAGVVTALGIAATLLVLAPLMHDLPRAALAAIIMVAVAGLIEWRAPLHLWQINRADAAAWIITFLGLLVLGVEAGIAIGVAVSLSLHLWRTARPHIAVVGRVPGTEHYRNVERHDVETVPGVLALRVDQSLYFANARYLEDVILNAVAGRPDVRGLVLICSAVNEVDATGVDTLEKIDTALARNGVRFDLAEVKGPVMDRLKRVAWARRLDRSGRIHLTTEGAMRALGQAVSRP